MMCKSQEYQQWDITDMSTMFSPTHSLDNNVGATVIYFFHW